MMLIFNIKKKASRIIDATGITDFLIKKSSSRIILGYHRILPASDEQVDYTQNCMWTSTDSFEKQILWMKKTGTLVSLDRIVDFTNKNEETLFAISFDDGWSDNYIHAFPILKKYNIPATIFLATDALETGEMFWPEEIYHKTSYAIQQNNLDKILLFFNTFLQSESVSKSTDFTSLLDLFLEKLKITDAKKRVEIISQYYHSIQVDPDPIPRHILTWDNVREMQKYNITFGSHTQSHFILQGADPVSIYSELVRSKQIIEKNTSSECTWFCYPNARYNEDDHVKLRKAGYRNGLTLHCSVLKKGASPFYLPRFIVYEDIGKVLGYLKLRILHMPYY